MSRSLALLLTSLAWLALAPADVAADVSARDLQQWVRALDKVERATAGNATPADALAEGKAAIEPVRELARAERTAARAELKALESELEALGPTPAEGLPAEAPEAATRRRELERAVGAAELRVEVTERIVTRADTVLERIALQSTARDMRNWEAMLDRVETMLAGRDQAESDLAEARSAIEPMRELARAERTAARAALKEQKRLLDALGPAPAEGEPAEPEDLAARRKALDRQIAETESRVKTADLVLTRADTALQQIAQAVLRQRADTLLTRAPSPLALATWRLALVQAYDAVNLAFATPAGAPVAPEAGAGTPDTGAPPAEARRVAPLLVLLPALAVLVGIGLAAGRLLRRLLTPWGVDATIAEPSYPRRLLAAMVVALTRGFVPALVFSGLLVVSWNLYLVDAVDPGFGQPSGFVGAIMLLLLGLAFVQAAFSPERPEWRIVPVPPEAALRLGRRLHVLVPLLAFDQAARFFVERTGGVPAELASIYSTVVNLAICALLVTLIAGRAWRTGPGPDADGDGDLIVWPLLRFAVLVAALATPLANALGYQALADQLLGGTLSTVLLLGALTVLHVMARELAQVLLGHERGLAASVRRSADLTLEGGRALAQWLVLGADLVLLVAGLAGAALVWGASTADLTDWGTELVHGVQVGSYTFAPLDVVLAVAALAALLAVTRLLQRFLSRRVFPQTRLDIGVRTAINAGIGYAGIVVAVLSSISVLGIDLGKLAIIAGALSVGIGFGLQNIVNNFVSGLILLIERPIKIGDWVQVGAVEGYVRRINVRATQIETFQRADVIIPNSELLQSSVVNMTHKSRVGRADVKVGVAYGTDIDLTETLLLDSAREHRQVAAYPAPWVRLDNFGDSSLDFTLIVYLDDVEQRGLVASDLRKDIIRRFMAAGIEIPFPQRDVWVRNWAEAARLSAPATPAISQAPADPGASPPV